MPINICLIEDVDLLAQDLSLDLKDLGYHVVATIKDYKSFSEFQSNNIDCFLVDIDLGKGKNGFDLVEDFNLLNIAPVIFLTSLQASVVKNRLKNFPEAQYVDKGCPINQLDVMIDVGISKFNPKRNNEFFIVQAPGEFDKIREQELVYLEADGNYCFVGFTNQVRKHYTVSMGSILSKIKSDNVVKCHRSYAINLSKIDNYKTGNVYLKAYEEIKGVPVGKSFRQQILQRFKFVDHSKSN